MSPVPQPKSRTRLVFVPKSFKQASNPGSTVSVTFLKSNALHSEYSVFHKRLSLSYASVIFPPEFCRLDVPLYRKGEVRLAGLPFRDACHGYVIARLTGTVNGRALILKKLLNKCIFLLTNTIIVIIINIRKEFQLHNTKSNDKRRDGMSKHLSPEVRVPIEKDNVSIFRDEDTCIKCGQCRDMCRDYIGVLGHYSLKATNDTAVCINCGQCANVCPAATNLPDEEINTSVSFY